jgi:Fe-Mn family superoxide dismutase
MFSILMVVDVFEHAYYIDYKNDRTKFVDAFFHIMNWNAVNKRLESMLE